MNRVNVRNLCGADDSRDVQITLSRRRRAYADGFVCEAHMKRVAVGLGVNGDRSYSHLLARPDNTAGNLAPVRNQNLAKPPRALHRRRTFRNELVCLL